MKYYIYFIISDTFCEHLPSRCDDGVTLGTELSFAVRTKKEALKLANKLIFLTTGYRKTVFTDWPKNTNRLSWSNRDKTHHCEVSKIGIKTSFSGKTKKGIDL